MAQRVIRKLSELQQDANHRLVTDVEKESWEINSTNVATALLSGFNSLSFMVTGSGTGNTPNPMVQADIDTLLALGIPQSRIIWIDTTDENTTNGICSVAALSTTAILTKPLMSGSTPGNISFTVPSLNITEVITTPTFTGTTGAATSSTLTIPSFNITETLSAPMFNSSNAFGFETGFGLYSAVGSPIPTRTAAAASSGNYGVSIVAPTSGWGGKIQRTYTELTGTATFERKFRLPSLIDYPISNECVIIGFATDSAISRWDGFRIVYGWNGASGQTASALSYIYYNTGTNSESFVTMRTKAQLTANAWYRVKIDVNFDSSIANVTLYDASNNIVWSQTSLTIDSFMGMGETKYLTSGIYACNGSELQLDEFVDPDLGAGATILTVPSLNLNSVISEPNLISGTSKIFNIGSLNVNAAITSPTLVEAPTLLKGFETDFNGYSTTGTPAPTRSTSAKFAGTYGVEIVAPTSGWGGKLYRTATIPSSGSYRFSRMFRLPTLIDYPISNECVILGFSPDIAVSAWHGCRILWGWGGGATVSALYYVFYDSGAGGEDRTVIRTKAQLTANTWYKLDVVMNFTTRLANIYLYDASGALITSIIGKTIDENLISVSSRYIMSGIYACNGSTLQLDNFVDGF